ncbi:hypothetical protein N9E34_01555 [Opitutales bacterium]|nr:hypothetical protein [Opitutales bacterium]
MSAEIKITVTTLRNSECNATKEVQDFLRDSGFHDFSHQAPGNIITIEAIALPSGNTVPLTMKIPPNRGEKRLGILKALINELLLQAGDSMVMEKVDGNLVVRKVVSEEADPSSLRMQEVDTLTSGAEAALEDSAEKEASNAGAIDLGSANENDFLNRLLTLHQDGKEAISHPRSWANPPLLEVGTKQDRKVSEIVGAIKRANTGTGIWFSWTGSPGNGKSAAVGKIYRDLRESYDFKVRHSNDGLTPLEDTDPAEIPYRIEVHPKDERYAVCWLIQDASVLPDKYSDVAEPAKGLLNELEEAYRKGVSVVVCANRGVLEAAVAVILNNSDCQNENWPELKKIITVFDKGSCIDNFDLRPEGPRPPFNKVKVEAEILDNKSLLIGNEDNPFSGLLEKAIAAENWQACETCSLSSHCPWKQNRELLADDTIKPNFLKILSRAEAFGGQVIPFRAAVALVSNLLAGCPDDYQGASRTPCSWVKEQVKEGNFFALLGKRVYMQLFSSFSPMGVESITMLREKQLKALGHCLGNSESLSTKSKKALSFLLKPEKWPSTSLGLDWLLDIDGILQKLDPINAPLPSEFLDNWTGTATPFINSTPDASGLETVCEEIFIELVELVDSGIQESTQISWQLKRWISAFTLRLGALLEGKTHWSEKLDTFVEILAICRKEEKDENELRQEIAFKSKLTEAMGTASSDDFIKVNENFEVTSRAARESLKPRISPEQPSNLLLSIEYGKEHFQLKGELLVWLLSVGDGQMLEISVPEDVNSHLVDTRNRAASSVGYAGDEEATIRLIDTQEQETLQRVEGRVVNPNE